MVGFLGSFFTGAKPAFEKQFAKSSDLVMQALMDERKGTKDKKEKLAALITESGILEKQLEGTDSLKAFPMKPVDVAGMNLDEQLAAYKTRNFGLKELMKAEFSGLSDPDLREELTNRTPSLPPKVIDSVIKEVHTDIDELAEKDEKTFATATESELDKAIGKTKIPKVTGEDIERNLPIVGPVRKKDVPTEADVIKSNQELESGELKLQKQRIETADFKKDFKSKATYLLDLVGPKEFKKVNLEEMSLGTLEKRISQAEKLDTKRGEAGPKQEAAMRNVMRSANLVTSAMGRLAEQWSKAYKEGGVGDRFRSTRSFLALWWGGGIGDKFGETAALPGLETEIITKMMPIMTQQGEKEGSVRLIRSIYAKLEKTIPQGHTGPGSARNQMEATIRNMYGFSKAFFDSGIASKSVDDMSEEDFASFVTALEVAKDDILESPEERKVIDEIVDKVLAPVDDILSGKTKAPGLTPEEKEELRQLEKEGY